MKVKLGSALAMISLLAASSPADVVIKQKTSVNVMGFMNMDMDGTQYVKGDKSCSSGDTKIKGGMAAMMGDAASSKFAEITRLDKGVMWNLEPKEKTYTETKLASFQQDMAKGQEGVADNAGNPEDYDWTTNVTSSDETENINGFKCKKITGEANGVKKDNPDEKMHLKYEYWYAKDVPGYDELQSHYKKFGEVTGVDMMQAQPGAEQLLGRYSSQLGEMAEQIKKANGVPIKMAIMVEGTQAAQGSQGEMPENTEGMPPGMKDMLSGMMNRGQAKGEGGMTQVFSMTSEVTSIKKEAVDDSRFEIPADYKMK